MGADQYLLPHLGAQARILLDRFVASGAAGVGRRDTDDWVLSRLIQLRYVQESTLDDAIFVCTAAGRHRWQIEMMADERRGAMALHRQLIRRRLDERFTRLGIDTSTALMTVSSPPEPRLHRRVPAPWNPPPQTRMRLSSPLATVFAATAVALVVISANAEPQDMRDWLFAPKQHAAAVPADRLKADAGQMIPVGRPAAAAVVARVDLHSEKALGHVAGATDVAPVRTQRAASIDTTAPSQAKGYDNIAYQAEQRAIVRNRTPTQVEAAGPEPPMEVHAASAILNSAVAATALIDAVVSGSGHIATDLATGTERGFRSSAAALIDAAVSESGQVATDVASDMKRRFKPMAAALLQAADDVGSTVSEWHLAPRQVRDAAPAAVVAATETPSERDQPAALGVVPAPASERATPTGPARRHGEANVDQQHAAVERLNTLSLAAARRGETWRPSGRPI